MPGVPICFRIHSNKSATGFDAKPLGMNELKLMENLAGCRWDKAVDFFRLMSCVADLFAGAAESKEEFSKVGQICPGHVDPKII